MLKNERNRDWASYDQPFRNNTIEHDVYVTTSVNFGSKLKSNTCNLLRTNELDETLQLLEWI